jgi:hypothetical protein
MPGPRRHRLEVQQPPPACPGTQAFGVVADANAKSAYGISGSAADILAGTLNVTTVGSPTTGEAFPVVAGTGVTGQFGTVNSAVAYTLNYASTGLSLVK